MSTVIIVIVSLLLLVLPGNPVLQSEVTNLVQSKARNEMTRLFGLKNDQSQTVLEKKPVSSLTSSQIQEMMTSERGGGGCVVMEGGWCSGDEEDVDGWISHPDNCTGYVVCSEAQAREILPCGDRHVLSSQNTPCVPLTSLLDDNDEETVVIPSAAHLHSFDDHHLWPDPLVPESRDHGFLWQPPLSESQAVTSGYQTVATPVMDAVTANPWKPEEDKCGGTSGQNVLPHPGNCAWYFNCSFRPDAVMETYHSGLVMECPYPQLFSPLSLHCDDFEAVHCGDRYEPKSPCEYRANHCQERSHCIPCWVRYASCVGVEDGLHPWSSLFWHPFFVQCYRHRTVFQGSCNKSSIFSPLTRTCELPSNISDKHGEMLCSCRESRDGKYTDENERCEWYYAC